MSLSKYQAILTILSLASIALFTVVNYFAFYDPDWFVVFILVEISAITVALFTILIAVKLKSIVLGEGYKRLSEEEIYELKNQKIRKGINTIMNTKKFLNTNTVEGVSFDRVIKEED